MHFGSGNGDYVEMAGQITSTSSGGTFVSVNFVNGIIADTITMGDGKGDFVSASSVTYSQTNFAGSSGATTTTFTFYQGLTGDTITIGNGNNDHVTSDGDFYQNTIALGNGNNYYVLASGLESEFIGLGTPAIVGQNTIALGNGNNDAVTIDA
jgi:hypothetical protein